MLYLFYWLNWHDTRIVRQSGGSNSRLTRLAYIWISNSSCNILWRYNFVCNTEKKLLDSINRSGQTAFRIASKRSHDTCHIQLSDTSLFLSDVILMPFIILLEKIIAFSMFVQHLFQLLRSWNIIVQENYYRRESKHSAEISTDLTVSQA